MRLIVVVISAPEPVPEEGKRITQLFEAGLDLFHIRKPKGKIEEVAKLLDDIPNCYHERVAFHQHHDWVRRQGFRRLHFPSYLRRQLTLDKIKDLESKNNKLSTSIHEIATMDKLGTTFSYSFLGPVFPSISKPGYQPKANFLTKTLPKSTTDLIALGGIKASNILEVAKAGFEGIALLGSIWSFPPQQGLVHFKESMQTVELSST
ncbi:thiamine phosphate synthase [Pleomorphovibrio marinus]|uniref:thiamine phosphate synthase n=1 Tax=Pleomorphovibrio marinus TaxID=2164132 RepID=UPI000E0A50AA|nr:thiamine phosphate synthase [Pleomorphovibrio marinus]